MRDVVPELKLASVTLYLIKGTCTIFVAFYTRIGKHVNFGPVFNQAYVTIKKSKLGSITIYCKSYHFHRRIP